MGRLHISQQKDPLYRRRAIAAATLILACVAVVAFMDSADANSAWGADVAKESVNSNEDDAKESELAKEAGAHVGAKKSKSVHPNKHDAKKLVHPNKRWKKVDDIARWKELADQAVKTTAEAKVLKIEQKTKRRQEMQKSKVEKQAKELGKANKHAAHQKLRKQAEQTTTRVMEKALGGMMDGVSAAAQKVAAKAAYKAALKKKKEAKATQVATEKAIQEEQEVQTTINTIFQDRRQLKRIKAADLKDAKLHKKEQLKFATAMRKHVAQTKKNFKHLQQELAKYRNHAMELKKTSLKLKKKSKVADALKIKVEALQSRVEQMKKKNLDTRNGLARSNRAFKRKKKKMLHKFKQLNHKMKKAIKQTAIRKATPHQDAQVLLNSLIEQEHRNDLKITRLALELKQVQGTVHSRKQKEARLVLQTNKQANALKLAHVAVGKMTHADQMLSKLVNKVDLTAQFKTNPSLGVDYTNKLVTKTIKTVKTAAQHVKGQQIRKVEQHLARRSDPVEVRKALSILKDKTSKAAKAKAEVKAAATGKAAKVVKKAKAKAKAEAKVKAKAKAEVKAAAKGKAAKVVKKAKAKAKAEAKAKAS